MSANYVDGRVHLNCKTFDTSTCPLVTRKLINVVQLNIKIAPTLLPPLKSKMEFTDSQSRIVQIKENQVNIFETRTPIRIMWVDMHLNTIFINEPSSLLEKEIKRDLRTSLLKPSQNILLNTITRSLLLL